MTSFGGFAGTCVTRTTATCNQSIGAGCPCLDTSQGNCNENAGGYCQGADDPTACWTCHLPV
jgi:hypothetical protein